MPETFERLGERTWVWLGDLGRHEQTNVGVIPDEHALVLVDGNFEWATARIAPAAREEFGLPVRHVVNTHYHVDHSLGNGVFVEAGATIVGALGQRRELLEKGAADALVQVKEVPERFYPAELEFRGTIVFPFSGLELHSLPTAHTASDVIAWMPDDAVLFVGDLAVAWEHGNNFGDDDSDIDGWIAALDRCLSFAPRVVVPAHGRVGGPEILTGQRDFMRELWDWARAAPPGVEGLDAATAAALAARHPDFAVEGHLGYMSRTMLAKARHERDR